MIGSLDALFAATALFVGGHFMLSSMPVRLALIDKLGETRFLAWYSVLMVLVFAWMVLAYIRAPVDILWETPDALLWLPALVMPLAIFLIVGAVTTPSPTIAGSGPSQTGLDLTRGIIRITRHPFLNAMSLWAAVHLVVNGDTRAVILFAGLLILSVVGMFRIDKRREFLHGSDWGPVLLTTSLVPFGAILSKRTRMDWAGIGWWRLLLSVAIYLALVGLHPFILGAAAWPGLG